MAPVDEPNPKFEAGQRVIDKYGQIWEVRNDDGGHLMLWREETGWGLLLDEAGLLVIEPQPEQEKPHGE